MEKSIKINVSEDGKTFIFEQNGLTNYELLGILRYLEKSVWMEMQKSIVNKQIKN